LHLPACRSLGAGRGIFDQPEKNEFSNRLFILDFAYISRKLASDSKLFPLKTKKYIRRHPHDC